jgi:hypothetical protein
VCVALPLLAIFTLAALRNRTALPHWPGVAYFTLLPAAAAYLAARPSATLVSRPALVTAAAFALALALAVFQLDFGVFPLDRAKAEEEAADARELGEGDPTTELIGWRELQRGIERLREEDRLAGKAPATLLFSHRWYHAAHLDFYAGSRIGLPTACLADLEFARALAFMVPSKLVDGVTGYFVVPSNRFRDPLDYAYGNPGIWLKDRFARIDGPRAIEIERGGRIAKRFYVYRCEEMRTPKPFGKRPKRPGAAPSARPAPPDK